jgi:hypothetical protein
VTISEHWRSCGEDAGLCSRDREDEVDERIDPLAHSDPRRGVAGLAGGVAVVLLILTGRLQQYESFGDARTGRVLGGLGLPQGYDPSRPFGYRNGDG